MFLLLGRRDVISGLSGNLSEDREKVASLFRVVIDDLHEYVGGDATHDFQVCCCTAIFTSSLSERRTSVFASSQQSFL